MANFNISDLGTIAAFLAGKLGNGANDLAGDKLDDSQAVIAESFFSLGSSAMKARRLASSVAAKVAKATEADKVAADKVAADKVAADKVAADKVAADKAKATEAEALHVATARAKARARARREAATAI